MTRIQDIDTNSIVEKFISNTSTSSGTIESITTAFLLNPQLALSFILKAKNKLQTLIQKEKELLTGLLTALSYINNTDYEITNTSELDNAQVFLLELNKIGKIKSQALENYNSSIESFLQKSLAKTKSGSRGRFALTSNEAKEDIYIGLVGFLYYHTKIINLIKNITKSVEDFKSSDLAKLVSVKVVDRIRASVSDTKLAIDDSSKVSIALELLAGKAALTSLSGITDIYDPIVKTNQIPLGSQVKVKSEVTSASITSNPLPQICASSTFGMGVDGITPVNFSYPRSAVSNNVWISSSTSFTNITIPTNGTLYIRVTVAAPMLSPATTPNIIANVIPITLTSGNRTFEQVRSEIESKLSVPDVGAGVTRYGWCTHFGKDNSKYLMIYGSDPNLLKFEILGDIPGWYNVGMYQPPKPSIHALLGFEFNQVSNPIGNVTAPELKRFIDLNFTDISTEITTDSRIKISSLIQETTSSLAFLVGIATQIGIPEYTIGSPSYFELTNFGVPVNLSSLDVYPNYTAIISNISYPIIRIEDSKFYSNIPIPVLSETDITVISELSTLVKILIEKLMRFTGAFDADIFNVQQVITPILSLPSMAQIGDCKKTITLIVDKLIQLIEVLGDIMISGFDSKAENIAKEIVYVLETRGMDKLIELLNDCKFSKFFASNVDGAASGTNLISAIDEVGKSSVIGT